MENEKVSQETNTAEEVSSQNTEDKTSQNNESVESLKVQKAKYKEKAEKYERELEALKKSSESKGDEKSKNGEQKQSNNDLLEKAYLRSAGIVDQDEVELALEKSKKWEVSLDKLVDDEDFKVQLEKLRTSKSNAVATSGVRGGGGESDAKNKEGYWLSKGVPPTREQVPDRKTRAQIQRAFMAQSKNSKKFYND